MYKIGHQIGSKIGNLVDCIPDAKWLDGKTIDSILDKKVEIKTTHSSRQQS